MDTPSKLRVLELCAGYGGFSLGLRLAVPGARTVCYVEREAFAAAVLVRQMEAGGLDPAPVWTDLRTFDGRPWRGAVDLVTAGFPCQPFSAAGKRRGEDDERFADVWPHIARIVAEVRPWGVFLENVAIAAFRRPRADLADLGYRVPPAVEIGAVDVGAPHRRKRWWCLATDASLDELRKEQGWAEPGRTGATEPRKHGSSRNAPDAERPRLEVRQGEPGDAGEERETAERGGWRLTEPPVCRADDGTRHRLDRLRALGNGVVPQCVAAAWRILT